MPEGEVCLLGWELSGHLHLHHAAPVHSRPCLGLVSAWLLKACPSMCCGEPLLVPQEKGRTAQQQILGSRSLRLMSPHKSAGTRHAMALYVSLATRPVLLLVLVQMARCLPKCLPLHLAHGMGAPESQAGSHPGREAVMLHRGELRACEPDRSSTGSKSAEACWVAGPCCLHLVTCHTDAAGTSRITRPCGQYIHSACHQALEKAAVSVQA